MSEIDRIVAREKLLTLIDEGLTFAECVQAFYDRQDKGERTARIIEKAREQWHRDGDIELDDNAIVSGSTGNGDYVMAWVWVYDDEEAQA